MNEQQIYEMLSNDPETQEEVILQAYQLGRLLGRAEGAGRIDGDGYDGLCEFVADKTAGLVNLPL
jgi:hypothetical protein